jgi:serine protease
MTRRLLGLSLAFQALLSWGGEAAGQPAALRPRLHVLLSTDEGAPTPDYVVGSWNFESKAPTPGLAVGNPQGAWYLLPRRATGDFKALLDGNPDTPRARLERYIVVEYPDHISSALGRTALLADPNIEAVFFPIELELSAATLQTFVVEQPVPLGGGYNYGRGI